MDKNLKKEAISKTALLIEENYVFPDLAAEISKKLMDNYSQNKYEEIESSEELVNTVNEDLENLSNDKHLRIGVDAEVAEFLKREPSEEDEKAFQVMARDRNYGFKEAKMLEGNIGYLNLKSFLSTEACPEAITVAQKTMSLFSGSQAIIFDLRENGGGSPEMVQLLTSYLFEGEPFHLNSFYDRLENTETETWTLPNVEGERFPDTKVFILTSKSTFSAAEDFTYSLKNLKRATVIGEVTGGGAHPGRSYLVSDDLAMFIFISSGRAINPITQTNWEGVGVKPDVEVAADEALDVALQLIKA